MRYHRWQCIWTNFEETSNEWRIKRKERARTFYRKIFLLQSTSVINRKCYYTFKRRKRLPLYYMVCYYGACSSICWYTNKRTFLALRRLNRKLWEALRPIQFAFKRVYRFIYYVIRNSVRKIAFHQIDERIIIAKSRGVQYPTKTRKRWDVRSCTYLGVLQQPIPVYTCILYSIYKSWLLLGDHHQWRRRDIYYHQYRRKSRLAVISKCYYIIIIISFSFCVTGGGELSIKLIPRG